MYSLYVWPQNTTFKLDETVIKLTTLTALKQQLVVSQIQVQTELNTMHDIWSQSLVNLVQFLLLFYVKLPPFKKITNCIGCFCIYLVLTQVVLWIQSGFVPLNVGCCSFYLKKKCLGSIPFSNNLIYVYCLCM